MKDIVIIGAGDLGREVAWLIRDINCAQDPIWQIQGFIDDDISLVGKVIDGYKVLGTTEWLKDKSIEVVCGIGNASIRKKVVEKLSAYKELKCPMLIHPKAHISDSAVAGNGAIICAGSILAINAQIGDHVYINLSCTIGHDDKIGNYSIIAPGVNISGRVEIGECVDIGTGAAVIQGITITSEVVIGAGAVVVKDINESGTYVGVPVRKIIK